MGVLSRWVAATLTALLHLLVVVVLTWSTARPVQPPAPAVQSISAEKLHGAGEQIVEVDIRPGLATHGIACEGSSYIGVGVTADPRTDRIILVGDDTPASRAGLQHDDIVLNPGVWQHAHVDGALLHVVILRDRARLAVRVLVGRICIG